MQMQYSQEENDERLPERCGGFVDDASEAVEAVPGAAGGGCFGGGASSGTS